jgi:hypothetical protein
MKDRVGSPEPVSEPGDPLTFKGQALESGVIPPEIWKEFLVWISGKKKDKFSGLKTWLFGLATLACIMILELLEKGNWQSELILALVGVAFSGVQISQNWATAVTAAKSIVGLSGSVVANGTYNTAEVISPEVMESYGHASEQPKRELD